jgi:hypothetical protein
MDETRESLYEWSKFKQKWDEFLLADKEYKTNAIAEEKRQAACLGKLEPLLTDITRLQERFDSQNRLCEEHRSQEREDRTEHNKARRDWVSIVLKLMLGSASILIALAALLWAIVQALQKAP